MGAQARKNRQLSGVNVQFDIWMAETSHYLRQRWLKSHFQPRAAGFKKNKRGLNLPGASQSAGRALCLSKNFGRLIGDGGVFGARAFSRVAN